MNIFNKINKRTALIGSAGLVLATGTGMALYSPAAVKGEETPPIVLQVDDHEKRIGNLETKTDATQDQVNQNTDDIKVIQSETGVAPAPRTTTTSGSTSTSTTPSTNQTATPQPQPELAKDPLTITAVSEIAMSAGTKGCKYTLYGTTKPERLVYQSVEKACLPVGSLFTQNY